MGTARAAPTMPLKSRPILAKNPRLETSFEDVIEFLQWEILCLKKGRPSGVAPRATPLHPTHPEATWADRAHFRASQARPVPVAPQSQWSADIDRWPGQGTSHPQSRLPYFHLGRLLRDTRSNM